MLYPYNASASCTGTSITTSIPTEQVVSGHSCDPSALLAAYNGSDPSKSQMNN